MDIQELLQTFVYNQKQILQDLPHIKKYNAARNLHAKLNREMGTYLVTEKYNYQKYLAQIEKDLQKETKNYQFKLNVNNFNDEFILYELTAIKNHPDVPAMTEIFLKEKRYQNEEEKEMLESLIHSYASLFKVISGNINTGYVTLEDVFTKERYKIIDTSLSLSFYVNHSPELYMYNRLIEYNGIRFASGIPCVFHKMTKPLQKLIKECEEKNYPSYSRCVRFYNLSKLSKNISMTMNTNF